MGRNKTETRKGGRGRRWYLENVYALCVSREDAGFRRGKLATWLFPAGENGDLAMPRL